VDERHGNESAYLAVEPSDVATTIDTSCEAIRHRRLAPTAGSQSTHGEPSAEDLRADSRVPITGRVVEKAMALIRPGDSPRDRAQRIFQYVVDTFEYDPRGCTFERHHALGDLEQACDLRLGTCTELHGIFVSCARAAQIPARFIFGFNIPDSTAGHIRGYHCWSEIFLPELGWTPVDVSEARKRDPGVDREFYFGNLDASRIQFTVGRDVVLSPPQQGPPLDRFIFPHAESAGAPFAVRPVICFRADDGPTT
jgi:transglutaminase-like putative cysteine protease